MLGREGFWLGWYIITAMKGKGEGKGQSGTTAFGGVSWLGKRNSARGSATAIRCFELGVHIVMER